ncbi:hypothetical protein B0T18DRAFT_78128 [Schizothecium vesticola]|uniref:SWIM-type domain-containing protein n=1 Tax=Schizothecium vesticola TaxID=314040 RepID=A0AA40F6E2_9PEZI|nr:hypothetical protein B0T18DRAFT_78128 [Schizothecium vesticola]
MKRLVQASSSPTPSAGNVLISDNMVFCFSWRGSSGKRPSCRFVERDTVVGIKLAHSNDSVAFAIITPHHHHPHCLPPSPNAHRHRPTILRLSSPVAPQTASLGRHPISRYQFSVKLTPLVLPRFRARNQLQTDLATNSSRCNCGIYYINSQCGHVAVLVEHACGRRQIAGTLIATLCTFSPAYRTCNHIIVLEPLWGLHQRRHTVLSGLRFGGHRLDAGYRDAGKTGKLCERGTMGKGGGSECVQGRPDALVYN